uniref:Cadherin 24 n=1 Tax=Poecilia latipinna TaxID=48699 RepID=A0A3B3VMH3_9TELE
TGTAAKHFGLHTDMDRGDGRTKYMLEGEGVGSVFVIDGNTGNIHVTKALDREEKDEYRLTATATDRETGRALEPSSEFIIRVQDINDNPPIFPDEPYVAVVPEMANIGTSITRVTATDADDPTYGNSARLVYGILQGQDLFSVDPQTGILRTAVPDMDRETQDEYLVVLQAKDMGGHLGGLTGTTTVTVKLSDVNDNPPHFRRSAWSFSVSELAAPGVEVGRLTATDPDLGENAQLEFTILDAEGADIFNVTSRAREAVIVLNKVSGDADACTLNAREAAEVYHGKTGTKRPFKDQATVRVMILNADEPPRFSQAVYHLDVSENCPPVCAVGRVHAVDPDTGQSSNIRYSIDPQSDPEALFRIASDKGFISAVVELDREQEQWHNISVIATQRGMTDRTAAGHLERRGDTDSYFTQWRANGGFFCNNLNISVHFPPPSLVSLPDNPNLVSRAVVAIETLDQNDNAPELDRQYATSVCDSSAPGQVCSCSALA